jgi:DNA-binding transcriptional regulator GbsR (MarR family)
MTQEQLTEELGCSLSAVSQSLTILEKVGLIHISGKTGRKNIYSAESSLQNMKKNHVENVLRFYIEPICSLLNSRIDDIKDKELKKKVTELRNFYSKTGFFIKAMLKMPFGKKE